MLFARSLLAFSLFFSFAGIASAEQIVFLNFGSTTDAAGKENQDICNEDGGVLLTLKKDDRLGFIPTDIGFDNNDNRAACIQEIVDLIEADYEGLNITFVTEEPDEGEFSTINVVAGTFPDWNGTFGDIDFHYDAMGDRLRIGDTDEYIDLNQRKLVDENGDQILDEKNQPICFPNLDFPRAVNILGIAQEIDEGNENANKQAWVFTGAITSGTAQENKVQLAHTMSHELGHLLGLEHDDGIKGSIMGELNDSNYGMDKGFTDGLSDTGFGDPSMTDSQRKLRATLPAKEESEPRTRTSKSGDRDSHGTGEPQPPTGDPLEDLENQGKRLRSAMQPHMIPNGRSLFIDPFDIQPGPFDPPFMDVPLPNGEPAFFDLPLPPGLQPDLVDMWLEIQIANLDDTNPANDTRLFVDGLELPGAFDGVNQPLLLPPLPGGGIVSQRLTIWLPDFFELPIIESILADGLIQVDLLVGGNTPWISVDNIKVTVTDNFTPPVVPCPGDCNGDGFVDFTDLVEMLGLFGQPASGPGCDPDGSGITDFSDLVQTLSLFGPCES